MAVMGVLTMHVIHYCYFCAAYVDFFNSKADFVSCSFVVPILHELCMSMVIRYIKYEYDIIDHFPLISVCHLNNKQGLESPWKPCSIKYKMCRFVAM